VVGAGVPHDVGDELGMFFDVQGYRVRHLTLPIVAFLLSVRAQRAASR